MARKTTGTPKIAPEGGWELHSRYGALKDSQGNSLESLEAVHALLMKRDGLTSLEAAVRVFGPFVADANTELGMMHGAAALRRHLQIVDPSDKASAVDSQTGRAHVERAAELLPYLPHHHFESGTSEAFYYALGVIAGEAWSQNNGNLDLNERLDGYCVEGGFPSIEKVREILGPFAVRHELAHKLWGWGSVEKAGACELTVVQDVQATGIPAPVIKVTQRELAPEWTGPKLARRLSELKKQCRERGTRNYTQLLSTESGVPVREITRRINAESGSAIAGMAGQLKRVVR